MADLELTPAHGGQALLLARLLGRPLTEIVDFSASINPFGPPPAALEAAQAALAEVQHYPESDAASLRQALAFHHQLPESNLLVGNGSTELLYLLPRLLQPRRALIVTPAFSEYRAALLLAGVEVVEFPLAVETGFALSAADLIAMARSADVDLVIIANPGNPTGAGIAPDLLLTVADALDGRCTLAVDEAFVDFCPQLSVLTAVPSRRNLFVFRSLTKFYAIPGLRVGFLAGPDAPMALLRNAAPPWSLNTPALAAARVCLTQTAYRDATLQQIPLWRQELAVGLTVLGCRVFTSAANYLLAELPAPAPTAQQLAQQLRQEGLMIRDCSNFAPLDGRYVRLAVRRAEENGRLLLALQKVLNA